MLLTGNDMAYRTAPFLMTLSDLRGYSPTASLSKRDFSYSCATANKTVGTDLYIHTCRPPHAAPYSTNGTYLTWRLWGNTTLRWLADSSDFGLLVEKSSRKWEISCSGRPWTIVQNLTPLALSSPDKSVTVQTTNNISTPCLLACVDN